MSADQGSFAVIHRSYDEESGQPGCKPNRLIWSRISALVFDRFACSCAGTPSGIALHSCGFPAEGAAAADVERQRRRSGPRAWRPLGWVVRLTRLAWDHFSEGGWRGLR